jgi:folylpolyglutamate synthase/dihydropteroate synthase
MLEHIVEFSDKLVITQLPGPRAAPIEQIYKKACEIKNKKEFLIDCVPEVPAALSSGVSFAGKEGLVVVAGSIVLAGEVTKTLP